LELYKNVLILKGMSPKILFKLFGRVFNVTSLLMRILRLAKVRFHQQLLILYGSPECQLMAGFANSIDQRSSKFSVSYQVGRYLGKNLKPAENLGSDEKRSDDF
jgi:hypothetical protein